MKSIVNTLFVLAFLISVISPLSYGQEKQKPKSKLEYQKLYDGSKKLGARIFLKAASGLVGVPGAEIEFTAETDSTKTTLGKVFTDEDGWAYLRIEKGYRIPALSGKTTFGIHYAGNDSIAKLSDDMDIINVNMEIQLHRGEEEKIATIVVTNYNGDPIDRTKVSLSVKRLYSLLPVGDDRTDSLGRASFIVPNDIPGDADGNIILMGLIERDRKFGNVEARHEVAWGVPNTYSVSQQERNLWTQSAPIWMQVAVFGVFIVVMVFFLYAVYQIYMIPKDR